MERYLAVSTGRLPPGRVLKLAGSQKDTRANRGNAASSDESFAAGGTRLCPPWEPQSLTPLPPPNVAEHFAARVAEVFTALARLGPGCWHIFCRRWNDKHKVRVLETIARSKRPIRR